MPAPARLFVEGLSKTYRAHNSGSLPALAHFTHSFVPGRVTALLGPSGSGKSTMLSLLAGLLGPDTGRILVDEEDITALPAERRSFGLVFQNYALFPHLSAQENIEFGLRVRGVNRTDRASRARAMLDLVRIPQLANRRPAQLSGGEQQRVAVARALAFAPRVLLMDEPLSALDAKLRDELRADLHALLARLEITTVYVTHDQSEAMALGHELVILRAGQIEQIGAPREIYLRPANAFVASFLGSANIFAGHLQATADGATILQLSFGQLSLSPTIAADMADGVVRPCRVMIRPEDIELAAPGETSSPHIFRGEIESVIFLGSRQRLAVRMTASSAAETLLVDLSAHQSSSAPEASVSLRLNPARIVVWLDAER